MQPLPLKFIHEDDKKLVGINLYNLARLKHSGLPVVESTIVFAPVEQIERIVHKYQKINHTLSDNLNNIKNEVLNLQMPENLTILNSGDIEISNFKTLWKSLLEKWAYELHSKIERGEKKFNHFTPQQVILSLRFEALGSAFFDEERDRVVIKTDKGKIDFQKSEQIEDIVLKGNKKLVLPQTFFWVLQNNEIKIIKLSPFTQSPPDIASGFVTEVKKHRPVIKTATKIIMDYADNFTLSEITTDAVFLKIQNPNIEKTAVLIEKIYKVKNADIIFYPDFKNVFYENREFANLFTFFRNKKKISGTIVLPQTFSKEEYLQLKRSYAAAGIYSKGSLKIWKQFVTIADFLNYEEYIDAGFDGALVDLDEIAESTLGVSAEVFITAPKKEWLDLFEKLLKEIGFNKIIKSGKPLLVKGKILNTEEVLSFMIKSGVWGVIIEPQSADAMREHISFLEKMTAKKLHRG